MSAGTSGWNLPEISRNVCAVPPLPDQINPELSPIFVVCFKMDFRRIPFQFSSTDPAKRQAELQKRFGLPVNTAKDKMHIDFENSGLMGFRPDERSSASSSPRLQHRVPVFIEGDPEPMKSSVDSQGSPVPGRKPHVRVIPIEIEGDDAATKRHRNLSGPANSIADRPSHNGATWFPEEFAPYVRTPVIDPVAKSSTMPRERSIPIQVEGVQSKKAKTVPVQKPKPTILKKETGPKHGCSASKVEKPVAEVKKPVTGPALSLKKIEGILEKLKTYHSDVEKFTGTPKDKQYRYLDEMLTRLMLELDDIDTMGNEEVRLSRKAAVRQVQASVDLLETKVTRPASEEMPIKDESVDAKVEGSQDVEMDVPTSQEDVISKEDDATPAENLPKLSAESAPETEHHSEVEDVAMESCAPVEEMEMKVPEEIEAAKNNYQIMEVGENTKCEMTTEPVIVAVDSPIEESNVAGESNETLNMSIELLSDSETIDAKEIEREPVVTLADSPMKETNNEISSGHVPNDLYKLDEEVQESSDNSTCCKATTITGQNVSCKDVPKLETNEHSDVTVPKHSPELSNNELLNS